MPHPASPFVAALAGALLIGCSPPCDLAPAGISDATLQASDALGGKGGELQGVYALTLTPSVTGSNCADARELAPESYAYTLEVRQVPGSEDPEVRIYVEGYPFAEGGQLVGDQLIYGTGERLEQREDGEVTYTISGLATLTADTFAGMLLWSGTERIEILRSTDPGVFAGCYFEYDVAGEKVCNE